MNKEFYVIKVGSLYFERFFGDGILVTDNLHRASYYPEITPDIKETATDVQGVITKVRLNEVEETMWHN